MEEYRVVADVDNNRFIAIMEGRVIGEVDFYPSEDGKKIIVSHTGVRSEFEGKGIAGAMTKAMLQYVREKGVKVVPVCRYTKVYIDVHPGYQDLL